MALKDIITSGKYADDMVLSLPDGTTATVGEMRALEQEERTKLIERANVLGQAEMEFATRFQQAVARQDNQQTFTDDNARRQAAVTQYGLTEDDPLLGQVVKEMKRMESDNAAKLAAMEQKHQQEVNKLAGITAKVTGEYLNDYYATKFSSTASSLPADVRKDLSLEDAVKYAETNRLMDKAGRYDIEAAVDRLTWEKRKEHELKAARAEATVSAEKAAAMARMKPSSALRTESPTGKDNFNPTVTENGHTRTKSLDEVLADAANDESLWAAALQNSGLN